LSNGLFIRSYPAVGAKIEPATYGPETSGYVLLGLIPVLVIWSAGPASVIKSSWLPWGLVIYAVGAIFATTFLRSLKLEIRMDGISYANLYRGTNFLAYSDISTVVLYTNPHVRQIKVWSGFTLPNTMAITPKPETGKPALKIPLDLFPDAAREQLTHLLRPEEWDAQS